MLTSAEGAYTAYLEARMGVDGVDAALVRTTLQQMGFNDSTVAAMMGETNAYASPFSSSMSGGSTTSASSAALSSVKPPGRVSRRSTGSSIPSAPSGADSGRGMGGSDVANATAAAVAKADDSAERTSGTAAAPASSHESPAPPSIFRESKRSSLDRGSGSGHSASPAPPPPVLAADRAAAISPRHKADSVSSVPTSTLASSQVSRSPASVTRAHVSNAHVDAAASASSAHNHAQSSVRDAAERDRSLPASAAALRGMPREAGAIALTPHECDVLTEWMQEYEALLLSSAMPRRSPSARAGRPSRGAGAATAAAVPPLPAAVPPLPADAPYDEFHAVPTSSTCSVGTAAAATMSAHAGQSPPLQPQKEEAADSEDGATSSSASSSTFVRSDRPRAPLVGDGLERHEDSNATAAFHAESYGFVPPLALSLQPPCRHVVPKARSSSFVPACGVGAPRCSSGRCLRCRVDVPRCRQPYREAQDARLIRAVHTADRVKATRVAPRAARAAPAVSFYRARQLDAAERAQHTAQATPMSGRCVPVMHQPVGPSVQPRSGLETGRMASTLSSGVKTDRVRLAQYYQRVWTQQDQRLTATTRGAVWDARYALLSCAVHTN